MSNDAPDLISLGLLRGDIYHERSGRVGRPPKTQRSKPPTLQVRQVRRGLHRVFVGFKRMIRPFVRALYLFPLLLIAKIVLWLMEHPAGDYITVGFIALLLIFFTLLAVLALLYPLVGPASQRKTSPTLALGDLDAARAEAEAALGAEGLELTTAARLEALLRSPGAVQAAVRVRGKVRAATRSSSAGDPLLLDGWVEGDAVVARLFCGSALALEAGEGAAPVVLDLQAPPLLVGRYTGGAPSLPLPDEQREKLASWLNKRSEGVVELARLLDSGSWLRLEAGQEVELVATQTEVLQDLGAASVAGRRLLLDQPEGGAPYRRDDARRGLLVTCTPKAPVLLRIL
jgi:hypothetical protein